MVKIRSKLLISSGLAATVGLSGCGKYEDGPNFSLLTKKQRLTGDWEVERWVPYGSSNMIGNGLNIDIEFDKDGDFDLRIVETVYSNYGGYYSQALQYKGEWEFSSDKEEIELDFDANMPDWDIEITRLTNKEFEGEIESNGYYYGAEGVFSQVFSQGSDKSGNGPGTIKFEAEKD
jgi:hypothetical protein